MGKTSCEKFISRDLNQKLRKPLNRLIQRICSKEGAGLRYAAVCRTSIPHIHYLEIIQTRFHTIQVAWGNAQLHVFTYLCPSLPVEHRPSTTPRHGTLIGMLWPVQLVYCCFRSVSVSGVQLLRGRALFLLSCAFQVRDWRVVLGAGFLRDCPIQPHFLRSIRSTWSLVPVSLAPTGLHFGSSPAIGICRCASDRP